MITPTDLIQEAGIFVSWGIPAFPLTGKKPRCKWKPLQRRRPSDREINRLFHQPDVDGIGVVPGPFSGGFAVRDYDDAEAYHRWAGDHPDLARTAPTVRTRRGFHVWTRSTTPAYRRCGDGEFIADGRHFTVVPPTRHPSGVLYEWLNGPPLGPSEFPLVDPVRAGFVTPEVPLPEGPKWPIRYSASSSAFSDSAALVGAGLPAAVRACILRTLPERVGERNAKVFRFARALRDFVPDDAPPRLLHDAISEWWRLALPVIGTKEVGVTLAAFRRAWADVRVPLSQSRPVRAMARGVAKARGAGADRAGLVLALCRELSAEAGRTFFLSRRQAATVTGVPETTARRLLERLVASGQLVIVRKGKPSPTGRTGTTWYRLGGVGEIHDMNAADSPQLTALT